MFKRTQLRQAVAAVFVLASGAGNLAFAAEKNEPDGTINVNDTIQTAQPLVLTSDCPRGVPVIPDQLCVEVNGVLGKTAMPLATNPPLADVDFYSFKAYKDNILTVDIDAGMKLADRTMRSVDTILAIFGPLEVAPVVFQRENVNMSTDQPLDDGSEDRRDALIENFVVPSDGTYVVGVSSQGRTFVDGGDVRNRNVLGQLSNGAYTLTISGVKPAILQVRIDVRPGQPGDAPINPKSKGVVPVAILSSAGTATSPAFEALQVNRYTLTFGSKGDETSYLGCLKHGVDVNADGLPDLVCHFDNDAAMAKWEVDDREGKLRGKTMGGQEFEGIGRLKIVPKERD